MARKTECGKHSGKYHYTIQSHKENTSTYHREHCLYNIHEFILHQRNKKIDVQTRRKYKIRQKKEQREVSCKCSGRYCGRTKGPLAKQRLVRRSAPKAGCSGDEGRYSGIGRMPRDNSGFTAAAPRAPRNTPRLPLSAQPLRSKLRDLNIQVRSCQKATPRVA